MIDEKKFVERLLILVGNEGNYAFQRKTGVSEANTRKYLKGNGIPTLKILGKIAEANNVTIGWLIGEEDENQKPSIIQPHFPNKSMQELAQWIAEQGDTINYWEVVKAMMARDYPEFDEWLKKRQGENLQISDKNLVSNDK